MQGVPEHLRDEHRAMEEQIRAAFHGVSRAGGVSWTQSQVIDLHGSAEEEAAARAGDAETCWEELVDDPNWEDDPGVGGFNFLDPIGVAYYLAPAMIRCARSGWGSVDYTLDVDGDFRRTQVSLLSDAQGRAVARFIRFMIACNAAPEYAYERNDWQKVYRSYWRDFDAEQERL